METRTTWKHHPASRENDSETWSLIWKEEEEEEEKVKTAFIVLHRFPFFIFYFFFSIQEKPSLGFQLTARDSNRGTDSMQGDQFWVAICFSAAAIRIIATIRGDCLSGDKANNVYGTGKFSPPPFQYFITSVCSIRTILVFF